MKNRIYSSLAGLTGLLVIAGCSVTASEHTQLASAPAESAVSSHQTDRTAAQRALIRETEREILQTKPKISYLKTRLSQNTHKVEELRRILSRGPEQYNYSYEEANLSQHRNNQNSLRRHENEGKKLRRDLRAAEEKLARAEDRLFEAKLYGGA